VTQGCLELHGLGLPVEEYFSLISAGATPSEVLDLHRHLAGEAMYDYHIPHVPGKPITATTEGLKTYKQGIKAYKLGRQVGCSHKSAMAVITRQGITAASQIFSATAAGATHGEIRRAHRRGINLRSYTYARAAGATHRETVAAKKAGLDIDSYGSMRAGGADHKTALKTASRLSRWPK
jgi:hypothetical protein